MKLNRRLAIIGSGSSLGFGLTHRLDCHVYLLNGGNELAIIDAGVGLETERIIATLENDGFDRRRVKYLLLTHCHADHAGGAYNLRQMLGCQVIAPHSEAEFIREADTESIGLVTAQKAGYYPMDYKFKGCPVDREVQEGDQIKIGDILIKVIDTPGHSIGGATYLAELENGRAAFVGDLVAYGGLISLQNIIGANVQNYATSVHKLEGLGIEMFLPGHLAFTLSNGQEHIDKAAATFRGLGVPKSII